MWTGSCIFMGGVVHSFTNKEAEKRGHPDAMRYSASADKRSFQALLNFLEGSLRITVAFFTLGPI